MDSLMLRVRVGDASPSAAAACCVPDAAPAWCSRCDLDLRSAALRRRWARGASTPRRSLSATTALSEDESGEKSGPGKTMAMEPREELDVRIVSLGRSEWRACEAKRSVGGRTSGPWDGSSGEEAVVSVGGRDGAHGFSSMAGSKVKAGVVDVDS